MKQRFFFVAVVLSATVMLFGGCASGPNVNYGQTYYTQINMWAINGVVDTLNYSIETRIPVNTPVRIESVGSSEIVVTSEDGSRRLIIEKNRRYTKESMNVVFNRYFSLEPVDLGRFNEVDREFIERFNGFYYPGVSKEAMIIGRGYPPSHRTPGRESNTWVYWRNRWKSISIEFFDDRAESRNGEAITRPEDSDTE